MRSLVAFAFNNNSNMLTFRGKLRSVTVRLTNKQSILLAMSPIDMIQYTYSPSQSSVRVFINVSRMWNNNKIASLPINHLP